MLAEDYNNVQSGYLDSDIHLPSEAKLEIVNFIARELPRWRDHPERLYKTGETALTETLCDYLNSAVYDSEWSHLQFRTETGDETNAGRKIDLVPKPRAATFIIQGRRHTQFDALFPIECKRLPTPKEKDRDEREYVITEPGTTGGIQRFKFGHHGSTHNFAAMIAYVQDCDFAHWLSKVNGWIHDLSKLENSEWSESDTLQRVNGNSLAGVDELISCHKRTAGLAECKLRHLWVMMN